MLTLKLVLLIGHVIGVALGAGGATMSDILFLTSISDRRIDKSELRLMKIATKVVVGGLVLLFVTGTGFFFAGSSPSQRFWAKLVIVIIASLNGAVMHWLFFPIFEECAEEGTNLLSTKFTKHAPVMITAGVVSAMSWYTAIILGMWKTLPLNFWQILAVYFVLMALIASSTNVLVMLLLPKLKQRIRENASDPRNKQLEREARSVSVEPIYVEAGMEEFFRPKVDAQWEFE